jgi:adenylate cyclase
MSEGRVERRLAAILAADVVGYSRLMGEDEVGTLARLKEHRRDLIDPKISDHKGRVVKTTGDGILIEFPSVVEAVACAVAVQREMAAHNVPVPQDRRIEFRVGINLGDGIVEGDDIHGDGVNVAARLEALAEPAGICVSGVVHDQVRGRLDVDFEDTGEQNLKNIVRPVRVYRVRLGNPTTMAEVGAPALVLPDKPSIAVLPFQNMSGDPEQEYFADGMVEEIITALSRVRWLFVIARNSSFTYKGQTVDVKRVGRELGVRYVLEGSVRKGGGQVRITAQLIEAETGAHLWADRFDGSLEGIFDLQDEVASNVAGVIEPTLQTAEIRRARQKPTTDLTAYDLYLRALPSFATWEKDKVLRALELFEAAAERDPHYGPALVYAAHCRLQLVNGAWYDEKKGRSEAIVLARRAIEASPEDPNVLASAAGILAFFGEDIEAAIALTERALATNPSSARGWNWSAWLRLWAGQADLAIDHFRRSMRLSPRDRMGMSLSGIGAAHFVERRFNEAVGSLRASIDELPGFTNTYRFLAAAYAYLGKLELAREMIERLRNLTLEILPPQSVFPSRDQRHCDLLLSGLRLAMDEAASLADITGQQSP